MRLAAAGLRSSLLLAALIAGCGHDPVAPSIANLRITPATGLRANDELTAKVDFADADGDLGGGSAELGLRRSDEPEGALFKTPLRDTGDATRGTITLTFRLPDDTLPGHHQLSVTVVDATERRSRPLVTELDVVE